MGVALSKRKASLDIIRIIALGMVLLIHCVENTWDMTPKGLSGLDVPVQWLILTMYNLGRLSVPLFLFLTGYLMLGREYKRDDIYKFYKTKVFHLLTITWLWTAIYYLLGVAVGSFKFGAIDFCRQMLFINNSWVAPHLWYMPMIIGLYLFIPFISNALNKVSKKVILLLSGLSVFYIFLVPTLDVAMKATDHTPLVGNLDLSFLGGLYGSLMLVGYLVKKYWNKLISVKTCWYGVVAIVGIVATVSWHFLVLLVWHYKFNTWYDSFFLLIAASATFIWMLRVLDKLPPRQYLYSSATAVMGCYLVHYIFIILFDRVWHGFGVSKGNLAYFFAMMAFVATAAIVSVYILRKFPRLAHWLGLRL